MVDDWCFPEEMQGVWFAVIENSAVSGARAVAVHVRESDQPICTGWFPGTNRRLRMKMVVRTRLCIADDLPSNYERARSGRIVAGKA